MSAPKIYHAVCAGFLSALTLGLLLLFVPPAVSAQRANSRPACRTCHAWEDPVVEQGEWHTIHALQPGGCICHGGNDRATDEATAHAGLIRHPLDNPDLTCRQCHPDDYQPRAEGVVVALGFTSGTHEPTACPPGIVSTPAPMMVTLLPRAPLRGWDWPVELAVAIVAVGLGVMRWRRVHSS